MSLKLHIFKQQKWQKLLFKGLGLDLSENPYDAAYYTEFDLLQGIKTPLKFS
jgi:hypothetical protein